MAMMGIAMPMVRRVASSTRRTPMTHSAIPQTAGSAIRSAFLCHVSTTYRVAKAETAARAISSTLMFFPFLMGYSRKMHTIIKSQWMLRWAIADSRPKPEVQSAKRELMISSTYATRRQPI